MLSDVASRLGLGRCNNYRRVVISKLFCLDFFLVASDLKMMFEAPRKSLGLRGFLLFIRRIPRFARDAQICDKIYITKGS